LCVRFSAKWTRSSVEATWIPSNNFMSP
jgi:hypothetical protein